MELINRKLLIKSLRDLQLGKFAAIGCEREYVLLDTVIDAVENQPVTYNVDKVVENVKRIGTSFCTSVHCGERCENCDYGNIMKAILKEIEMGGI